MTSHQPPDPGAVMVSADQVKLLLAALDDAAEYKRDRAATCADCADQPCTTCQWRAARRRRLRPPGRPDDPGHRSRRHPAARARPRRRRPGGRTMIRHRPAPASPTWRARS